MYFNCCCSCSFEREIIKIGQSSYKMYNNNILNFQESTTILNACTKKKSGNSLNAPFIYIYIYMYVLFDPVEPELGVIPSGQENHSKTEHLNFPGREFYVINITEQYFL